MNYEQRIEGYLGDFAPEDFENEEEIREYFNRDNLISMFSEHDVPDTQEELDELANYIINNYLEKHVQNVLRNTEIKDGGM